MVEKDVPFLTDNKKKYWSDLDILAVGEEVHLVNCKDYLPSNEGIKKVIENLDDAEKYIKREYGYLKNKKIKKIYVYGSSGKESIEIAKENKIETINLKDLLAKYFKELDDYLSKMNEDRKNIKIGKRYRIIGELEGLDKFVSFLLNNNFINDNVVNEILKKNNLPDLSQLK